LLQRSNQFRPGWKLGLLTEDFLGIVNFPATESQQSTTVELGVNNNNKRLQQQGRRLFVFLIHRPVANSAHHISKKLNSSKKQKMRLVIQDNADLVTDWAARYVLKRVKDFNPGPDNFFVLGLPTGNLQSCFVFI
jgi:hypothetical protein